MGEKKHINKIPPKIPGQSREHFVYVFFLIVCFFSLPRFGSEIALFGSKSGPNQAWREVLGGDWDKRGRSGWAGSVGPPESDTLVYNV